jgi:putative transposase
MLNGGIFYTLKEAQVLIESWRRLCNAIRPHLSLGYRSSAPEVVIAAVTPAAWTGASTAALSPVLATKQDLN